MSHVNKFLLLLTISVVQYAYGKPVEFSDPKGDCRGDGSLVLSHFQGIRCNEFDILDMKLTPHGEVVSIEVRMGGPIKEVWVAPYSDHPVKAFLPVVEIYVSDGNEKGRRELLPGRGAVAGLPWDRVVVIGALGDVLQAHFASLGLSSVVCMAKGVRVTGSKISTFVSKDCFMNKNLEELNYLIGVSMLRPSAGLRYKFLRKPDLFFDPLVVRVSKRPGRCGEWSAGECTLGIREGRVKRPVFLDVVMPKGVQERLLGAPGPLPFVDARGRVVKFKDRETPKGFRVADCREGIITVVLPKSIKEGKIRRGGIGWLYDRKGRVLCKVVVLRIEGGVVVLRALEEVDCNDAWRVRF